MAVATYIAGIGASAGGLEALTSFFENAPANTGFAFVILQHLSPDHKSLMVEILSKHTKMKVREAEEDMALLPDNVYLLPSKKFMTVSDGKLRLEEKLKSNLPNNAIDVFFESLGREYKSQAIGIVLSGTGTDGTKGLEIIKEHGGIVVVQDPVTASFDGMPNSAIGAEVADLIIPPDIMATELISYMKEPASTEMFHLNARKDEVVIRDILVLIRKGTGHDFGHYKKPTIYRRLSKRLAELNIQHIKDYLDYLNYTPDEVRVISQDFLINVTRFFRDDEAFDIIQARVVPAIMTDKNHGDTVKVWSVACSTGAEAYSLAILFHEYLERHNLQDINIKIFATDIDKQALETASLGIYPKALIEEEISSRRIGKYFTAEGAFYKVSMQIRKMVVFSYHDILKDPPFSRMDLITCRNMLIYINSDAQREIMQKLHFALNLDAYMFLGPSEDPGITKSVMEEVDKKWRIYKCISKMRLTSYDSFFSPIEKKNMSFALPKAKTKNALQYLPDLFKETLSEQQAFAGIFIDANMEVKQATGNYKKFISFPDTGFNFNLVKLVVPDLAIALSVAVRKAIKDAEPVTMRDVAIHEEARTRLVTITVKPYLQQREYEQQFLFIVLNESDTVREGDKNLPIATTEELNRMTEMERELRETRANLQAVIEEVETANEELQSTNEEMLSTNEELQSTNEELQSLNEELHTVSAEHQQKIKEMMELNDDMNNYFKNSVIGQILVDSNLIIRKFSPAVTKIVNLIDADINRSIVDITTKFANLDLVDDIRHVMIDKEALEKEIMLGDRNYLMRITPYMRQDKSADGTVVNFIDVTDQRRAADMIAHSYEELKSTSGKLQSTNVELEQSNMDLVQFASVASHDLKEPLRKIQTYGNILYEKVKDKLSASELANLEKVIASSDRMQRLVEDVLTFSRLSNRDLTLEKVDLNNTLSSILDDLEITVRERKCDIQIGKLPTVDAVPGQMHQLFQNLLSNAMKFSNKDMPKIVIGEKTLTAAQAKELNIDPKDYVCVSIRDNGIGFEEEYKNKIFGIFQRLNGNNFEGTGIGLAVCKKIVENHGGFLFAESRLGEGAEFFIALPAK